jgi:hypothetical protein
VHGVGGYVGTIGVGLFAWLHPDLARLLLLVALSRWIWKWSA